MKELMTLNKYFFKYKWEFILGIICTVIANYIAILTPQFTGFIINKLTIKNASIIKGNYDSFLYLFFQYLNREGSGFSKFVLEASLSLLILALLRGFFMFIMRQTIIVGSRHIEFDLKNDIYIKYQNLDLMFYKSHFIGDLMNRISEDVNKVRMYVGPAIMYVINMLVLLVLSVYYMFKTNTILAIISLSPLPILAYIIYKLNSKIQKGSEEAQGELSLLTVSATETYSGIRVIQSFVQENVVFNLFKKIVERYQQKRIDLAKLEAFYFPSMTLLIGLSTLLTVGVGGVMVVNKQIEVAVVVEFVMYINMLIFPVSSIGWIASIVQSAIASQRRINEFMNIDVTINKQKTVKNTPLINGKIEFKNVDFIYQHTQIQALKNISLSIEAGKRIAIMGRMASGKSTLAQILVRSYDVHQGQILLNGNNIQEIDLHHLRNQINYVPQDSFIFSETILNNLMMVQNLHINFDVIVEKVKAVELYDEIMNMPNQWQTILGERGINLSGGQKQRLAIARSLINEKPIYIFDDCLSAVDTITEKKILNNLSILLKNKTCIFITNRVYENVFFDSIVVLNEGQLIEQGTRDVLLEKKGLYFNICESQKIQEN